MSAEPPSHLPPGEYISVGGKAGSRVTVSYRLTGNDLDPDSITELVGLEPRTAYRKGELRTFPDGSFGAPHRFGMWSMSTEGLVARTEDLDRHLVWLLDRLEPAGEQLRALVDGGYRADFFCGCFMGGWNSGWEVPAGILERIGQLGARIGLDIYGPEEPDAVRRISHGLTFNVFLDHLIDVAIEELAWLASVDAEVLDDDIAIQRAEAIVAHLTDLPHEDRVRAKEILERRLPITDEHHRESVIELVAHLSDDEIENAQ